MSRRRSVWVASLAAASIIALQVAGKATRDALFLGALGAERLPGAMLVSALASLATAAGISVWMGRRGPQSVAPRLLALATTGFALLAIAQPYAPRAVAYALFVHTGVVGPVVVSAFWSVINERFDPHVARRSVARIAGGATAGGMLGGLLAEGTTRVFGAESLLPLVAGLAVVVTVIVARFSRGASRPSHRSAVETRAAEAFRASGYLRSILALVATIAVAGALLDVALKTRVDLAYADSELPHFFARYYATLGLVTFGVQWLVAGRLLQRAGLATTLAALPTALLLGAGGALLFIGALPIIVARGATSIIESSLFRSAYELLYTPIAPGRKRAVKVLLDVGGTRLGDSLGSGIAVVFAALLPLTVADRAGLGVAVVLSGAALLLVRRLQRGYVDALAESVRSGALRLDGPIDAGTRSMLSTLGLEPPKREALEGRADVRMVLASRDPVAIREALAGRLDARTVDAALGLLSTEHARLVERRLRQTLPKFRDVLENALADPSRRVGVRAKLPALLAGCGDEAALAALVQALDDPAFGVRRAAGRSLRRLGARELGLKAPSEVPLAALRRELGRGPDAWRAQDERAPVPRATLDHALTLLALATDDETLLTCHAALTQGGDSLRGTAHEYLAQVIPEALRDPFFVLLEERAERISAVRDRATIADELLQSMSSLKRPRSDESP